MSSDENNISAQLKISAPKQKGLGARQFRRKRRAPVETVYKDVKRSISRVRQQNFPKRFASSPTYTLRYGNHPSTLLFLPTSKNSVPRVRPFRGQPNGHVKTVSEHENLLSTFHSKSSKFHTSSKLPFHTSVAVNDPTSHCFKIKGWSDNTSRSEKPLSCSSARTSKPTASSGTHKLISNCIRNSQIPINIYRSLATSTTSSRGRSYSRPLSFHTSTPKYHSDLKEMGRIETITQNINQSSVYRCPTFRVSPIETASQMTSSPYSTTLHSIPKDPPVLKERGISPCSTTVEVGSMETIQGNTTSSSSTAEPHSLSESSQHSSEPICDAPPNSRASQTSIKESWYSENGTESIKPEESLPQHVDEFLAILNPPESLTNTEEGYNTEKTVESVRQSFASLSMTYGPPTTDASEMAIPSNEPHSEQSEHSRRNKTRKKSKLISCFTACFRPSSPRSNLRSNFGLSCCRK